VSRAGFPRLLVATLAVAGLVALGACGNDGSGAEGPRPVPTGDAEDLTGQATVEVAARDNVFESQEIRIDPGTSVRWSNEGRNDHNVLDAAEGWSDAKPLPSDFGAETEDFGPGSSYEFTFEEPGTYAYYCSLHGTPNSGMFGTIVVGGS
jgi:plastocyanin